VKARVLVVRAAQELEDYEPGYENTSWSLDALLGYLQEALQTMAALKPEVYAISDRVQLSPGSRQIVPERYSRLVRVDSNATTGESIMPAHALLSKHFTKPECVSTSGAVRSYFIDENNPRVYTVQPPVPDFPAQYVEATWQAKVPELVSAVSEIDFPGGDAAVYQAPMLDWMLYRAFARDTESTTSLNRSQLHYKAFYQFFNVQVQLSNVGRVQKRSGPKGGISESDL
jgi:hypothetical protein